MAHTPGQPGPHDPSGAFTPPTAEEIYGWLGVRFAMLEAPHYRAHMVGWHRETTHADAHGVARDLGRPRPVEVRIGHELDDDTTIDVTTVRDDTGGASVVHHLWTSLINYQLALAGRRGAPPWGSGPPPPQYVDRLDTNNPPEPTGTRTLSVDGGDTTEWVYLACPDMATGAPLAACGGHIGTSLVMVTGPQDAALTAGLRMLPQPNLLTSV
ncbi:hypothetical protein GA0070558_1784 [Micromonospora haikouensis]|uniref:Uncharacterized protein n=1 Tax=Micromonospora haikouensis TaxID=686309 RepID=A0A1C4YT40_9ACTN|nr:hypothetical protein [Micromonospora haikouensis]SCF23868.1 hypothetical protein GA0070558_1784 [Micromonospora haikouensis]